MQPFFGGDAMQCFGIYSDLLFNSGSAPWKFLEEEHDFLVSMSISII